MASCFHTGLVSLALFLISPPDLSHLLKPQSDLFLSLAETLQHGNKHQSHPQEHPRSRLIRRSEQRPRRVTPARLCRAEEAATVIRALKAVQYCSILDRPTLPQEPRRRGGLSEPCGSLVGLSVLWLTGITGQRTGRIKKDQPQ